MHNKPLKVVKGCVKTILKFCKVQTSIDLTNPKVVI